jgi:DNA-binding transcriptional regulator YdaS (Cro superfamily)
MIEKVIELFKSRADLCRAIGMKQQFLVQIENGTKPLPAKYALKIEAATDRKITRQQLRPDIYPD